MEATDRQTGKTLCRLRSAGQICPLQCNQGLCKIVNGQPKCNAPSTMMVTSVNIIDALTTVKIVVFVTWMLQDTKPTMIVQNRP